VPLKPTTVPEAMGPPAPPVYVPPVTPPAGAPPSGRLARWRAWRATGARSAAVGRGVVIEVAPGATLELGEGCAIGDRCRVLVRGGTVKIGPGAVLGERCAITAHAGIEIGADAVLGDEAVVIDFDHRYEDANTPIRLQGLVTAPVVIGPGARIGTRAAIQRGVTIGDGAEVAAQSVVTRDVAPHARVGGVPARPAVSRSAGSGTPGGSRSRRGR
jgi:acetyltransferase-like isoleucine patch superfamily enzyme